MKCYNLQENVMTFSAKFILLTPACEQFKGKYSELRLANVSKFESGGDMSEVRARVWVSFVSKISTLGTANYAVRTVCFIEHTLAYACIFVLARSVCLQFLSALSNALTHPSSGSHTNPSCSIDRSVT
jgi:hypothetical protein